MIHRLEALTKRSNAEKSISVLVSYFSSTLDSYAIVSLWCHLFSLSLSHVVRTLDWG